MLQGGQHRGALHRTTVVRMQHHLARELAAFAVVDLPSHNLAAKNIQKQVPVKVAPYHQSGQVRDVSTEQLLVCCGEKCARLAALCTRPLGPAVLELVCSAEDAVKRRFRGHVMSLVGQPGNDLAGTEMPKLIRLSHCQHGLAFLHT